MQSANLRCVLDLLCGIALWLVASALSQGDKAGWRIRRHLVEGSLLIID